MSIEFRAEDGSLNREMTRLRQEITGPENDSPVELTPEKFWEIIESHGYRQTLAGGEEQIAIRMGLLRYEDGKVYVPSMLALLNHLSILKQIFGE